MGLKVINPQHQDPKKHSKYFFRYFHHAIGKGLHGDFRWKQNDHLIGWTIATLYEGDIKKDINTVADLKRVTEELDFKFKPDMDPAKHCLAFIKARQPLEWLEMYNKVIPPAAGPGASKENEGVFVLVDEGICYPGTKKAYFQELFLDGKQFKRRMVIRELETPKEWEKAGGPGEPTNLQVWMTKEQTPYILTPRGREEKTVPPKGESWLPPEWEKKIPEEFQWWRKENNRNKMINEAFNYLVDEKELKHRKIEVIEISFKEAKFALRFRSWEGAFVKRGMPNIKYDLLIDSGKECLYEWTMNRNPLAQPVTGTTAIIDKLCGKTPDDQDNSKWLEWEGSIPPQNVKLKEAEILRRIPDTNKYIVKIAGKEMETKSLGINIEILKPNTKVWLDNRKNIYTTNKGQRHNPNKVIPLNIGIIDSGSVNWIEDSELFSSFKFHGKKLKDYWIMKREEPESKIAVFKKSELPGGDIKMRDFRFAYPLESIDLKEHKVKIEILREGIWEHPEAPDGILEISKKNLEEFVKNFKDKIVGEELPLDYEHKPEKGHALGWIKNLSTKFKDGIWHLWAKLDVTDEKAQKDLKTGSLRYISPQILIGWKNPEDKKLYNVIRSAALTNYPYIKNMEPAVVNFEEIESEVNKMDEKEIKEREDVLREKVKDLAQREAKLGEDTQTLEKEKTDLKEEQDKVEKIKAQLQEGKYPGPFWGLPKAQATDLANKCKGGDQKSCDILIKYATGGVYGYPKAQMEEEGAMEIVSIPKTDWESMKTDVASLKDLATAKEKAVEAALEEVGNLTAQLEEKKIDGEIEKLGGHIVPAQKNLLKSILLANAQSTIELEEEEGKRVKVSTKEAILRMLTSGPAKVDLTQRAKVDQRALISDIAQSIKAIAGVSLEEWSKKPKEERDKILKAASDLKDRRR